MNKLFGPLGGIVDMVVGNPLTSVPGAVLTLKAGGAVLIAIGTAMTQIGSASSLSQIIDIGGAVLSNPSIHDFIAGIGLLAAKDWNVTGGTKQQ